MVVESTLKFLKTTVAEDAITMEEILVAEDVKVDLEVKEADHLQEEKAEETVVSEAIEDRLQEEKAEEMVVSEATEAQPLKEKVVSEAKEAVRLLKEKADFQTEHQDVQKVLEILQDQEDQEEANDFR